MEAISIQSKKDSKRLWRYISHLLISGVGFLCFFSAWWYARTYGRIGFDSVMFTLTGNLNGVNVEHLLGYLVGGALPAVLATALWGFGMFIIEKKWRPGRRLIKITTSVVSVCLVVHAAWNVGLTEYLAQSLQTTSLYEEYYADPEDTVITFPEEKRNLVYILLESMEVSYLSQAQGGCMEENLIPELYTLAQNHVNFSHNSHVGGFRDVTGTTWTMGALVAQSGGIPLKVSGSEDKTVILPGLTTLSDILHAQGYRQAFMVGSDADFGGRESYYLAHGVDDVYDLYTAWEDGPVEQGYDNQFWGMEDSFLYEYAKNQLTEMAQGNQPFAFTLLTVDTHSPSGYVCGKCESKHQEGYANVIACADRQIADFVLWLQAQPFYENTTIVIVGDHCSMNNSFFDRNTGGDYVRHIYNCFINSAQEAAATQNRQFTSLDLLPTTLTAIGCTIEGSRLGLGTDLFSGQPTLMEEYGYERLCDELNKRSKFYDTFLQPYEKSS